jgi:hypothetical protein
VSTGSDAISATAARLWNELGPEPSRVTRIDVLKPPHRKSAVFRLVGGGPDGQAVIAKRAQRSTIATEQCVYANVLSHLPVSSVRLFCTAEDPHAEFGWLFLEDAGDLAWSPELEAHQDLAAEWLGRVHVGAAALAEAACLPTPGADYYRRLVIDAAETLDASLTRESLVDADRSLIRSLAEQCVALTAHWVVVETVLAGLPPTLCLPGFSAKNVRVRHAPAGLELLPYDFENAFYGPPAIELQEIAASAYWRIVGESWRIDPASVELLCTIGGAMYALKSIPGEAKTIASADPTRAIRKLEYYSARILMAVKALGLTLTASERRA